MTNLEAQNMALYLKLNGVTAIAAGDSCFAKRPNLSLVKVETQEQAEELIKTIGSVIYVNV